FFFKDIKYGTYYLEFKFIGFRNKTINKITISADNKFIRVGKVTLDNNDAQLNQVVITGQASNVTYKIDKKIINVSKDIMASGGDATDALRNVPSVNVDVNGDVTIRGSSNFTVMINGKPSILDPNDALKSIPADNIEKIELITNPSAKYDPDGDAGIINIIIKNKKDDGFSGKIEIGGDNNMGYKGDILLNYKKNKINFFTQFTMRKRTRPMQYTSDREIFSSIDTFYMANVGETYRGHGGMDGKIGIRYYINDMTTLTFNGSIGTHGFGSNSSSNQHIWWSDNALPEYYFVSSNGTEMTGLTRQGEIDFEHKFNDKGHKIKAFAQYSFWNPSSVSSAFMDTTDASWNSLNNNAFQERTTENRTRTRARFQVDYELPIGDNSKFEAGYSFRYLESAADYHVENFDYTSNRWIENDAEFNNMTLYRQIHAGYTTFSSSLGNIFDYQLGLRIEYTDRLITEDVTNTNHPINRFDYFPTVHLSKSLPFEQQVQFSYSRRINRPRGWNLNPFPRYIDQYTIRRGNPALNPEYGNSFELNYLKTFGKNSISIETFYKITEGKIDRIQEVDGTSIIFTAANMNKDYALGSEISANFVFFKMLMVNIASSAYNYRITGTLEGVDIDNSTFTWNSKASIMTMLPTGTSIQFGAFYKAPSISLQGESSAFFMTFAGVRQSFFKRSLNVSLNVRDIFNTMQFAFTNSTPTLYSTNVYASLHPTVGLTITYRINNYKSDKRGYKNGDSNSTDFMGEGEY
ncbi:MAG: outer membrane beta-barrel family protein, partial [Bacteroidota bacterium]|nr:outer membrane beta-barrel family protein [Bacteroidota bacterium]